MTISEQLNAIADLIEARGWCQNTSIDSYGHICLSHALALVTNTTALDNYFPLRDTPEFKYLCKYLGNYTYISDWNDQRGRTQGEVVLMLRNAANSWVAYKESL